jgi:hypothetical protein
VSERRTTAALTPTPAALIFAATSASEPSELIVVVVP